MNIFLDPVTESDGFAYHYNVGDDLLPAVEYVESGSLVLIICAPEIPSRYIDAHRDNLTAALTARGATCSHYEGYGVSDNDVLALRPQLREIRRTAQTNGTIALYYLHQQVLDPNDRRRYTRIDPEVIRNLRHESDQCFGFLSDTYGIHLRLLRINRTGLEVSPDHVIYLNPS